MKKPWRLLAEMLKTFNVPRTESKWHRLEIGPHRMVRCSCGGAVTDHPPTGYDGGGCSHIVALYSGHVIEDKREYDEYSHRVISLGDRNQPRFRTRFTQVGKQMFYARYTVKALRS